MKLFFIATALGLLLTGSLIPSAQSNDPLEDKATTEKLEKWKVNVRWENGFDAKLALKDLFSKTRAADPNHLGVKFTLLLPSDLKKPDARGQVFQEKVNILLLDNPSVMEVLAYFRAQTNLSMKVRKNEVILTMLGSETVRGSN